MTESRPSRHRRRYATLLLKAVAALVVLEVASRFMITMRPWSRPFLARPHELFFPELAEIERTPPPSADELDVLLLGGSALDPRLGQLGQRLQWQLEAAVTAAVGEHATLRVFNLAREGRTSLDSLYAYRRLADRRFAAVIVLHGLDDVPANHCPGDVFRDDYGHLAWYRTLAGLEPPPDEPLALPDESTFMLPTTARYAVATLGGWLGLLDVAPPGPLREAWRDAGVELKTAATFRRNVEGLVTIARERGDPLLLLTCPTALDGADPSGRPGPAPAALRVERWGRPDLVVAAVAAHNAALRELAAAHPAVQLVELVPLRVRPDVAFRDVGHLTASGAQAVMARLIPVLMEVFAPAS